MLSPGEGLDSLLELLHDGEGKDEKIDGNIPVGSGKSEWESELQWYLNDRIYEMERRIRFMVNSSDSTALAINIALAREHLADLRCIQEIKNGDRKCDR